MVSIVETPEQRIAADRAQAEGRQQDARNLDAQIRAADAAEEQVFPSWLNAALGFIGTGLIVWTLYETRIANAVARREFARARIESKKAYAEARKSNEIAQKTAADQLRPYVQFTDPWGPEFKLKFENGEKIDFAFENLGKLRRAMFPFVIVGKL